jgi:predicted transcriptional regulator
MARNPKGSKWYATTQADRTRKLVSVTLSDEAREKLEALAAARNTHKSVVVETLIMEASLDDDATLRTRNRT